ncbi:hypothetical protein [Hymenobacter fodinae]|uniref:Uncharacterized protein n=1 Tax=Hymenobacter fodinae TaxID=2510796 RepID=A0A4Z0P3U9_9BACT|nr:hypothetical protein [Hymenobacter fodinae]TGE05575.1 hypothetical protein EU556_19945 [Hymenobacter fodinae]
MSFVKRLEEAQRAAQIKALGGEEAYQAYRKKRRRTEMAGKAIGVVVAVLLAVIIYAVVAWVIQWGWNAVVASFNGPELSYRGSCGIVVLLVVVSMFFKRSKS